MCAAPTPGVHLYRAARREGRLRLRISEQDLRMCRSSVEAVEGVGKLVEDGIEVEVEEDW